MVELLQKLAELMGRQDIEAALRDLLALLKEYAGGTSTSAILDAHHPALICSLGD